MTARHRNRKGRPDTRNQPDADALIRRATERPGIREVMRVYEDWKRVDRALEPYRAATTWVDSTTKNRPVSDPRQPRRRCQRVSGEAMTDSGDIGGVGSKTARPDVLAAIMRDSTIIVEARVYPVARVYVPQTIRPLKPVPPTDRGDLADRGGEKP